MVSKRRWKRRADDVDGTTIAEEIKIQRIPGPRRCGGTTGGIVISRKLFEGMRGGRSVEVK